MIDLCAGDTPVRVHYETALMELKACLIASIIYGSKKDKLGLSKR